MVCSEFTNRSICRFGQLHTFLSVLGCRCRELYIANTSVICRYALDVRDGASLETLLLLSSWLWARLPLVLPSSAALRYHTARLYDFLENLILLKVTARGQWASTMAISPALNALTVVALSGFKHVTLANIYDARPIALISLLANHAWCYETSFLDLRTIHEFWSSDFALVEILLLLTVEIILLTCVWGRWHGLLGGWWKTAISLVDWMCLDGLTHWRNCSRITAGVNSLLRCLCRLAEHLASGSQRIEPLRVVKHHLVLLWMITRTSLLVILVMLVMRHLLLHLMLMLWLMVMMMMVVMWLIWSIGSWAACRIYLMHMLLRLCLSCHGTCRIRATSRLFLNLRGDHILTRCCGSCCWARWWFDNSCSVDWLNLVMLTGLTGGEATTGAIEQWTEFVTKAIAHQHALLLMLLSSAHHWLLNMMVNMVMGWDGRGYCTRERVIVTVMVRDRSDTTTWSMIWIREDFGSFNASSCLTDFCRSQVELVYKVLGSSRGALSALNAVGATFFHHSRRLF